MSKQNQITLRRLITLIYLADKYNIGIRKEYYQGSQEDYKQRIYFDHITIADKVKKVSLDDQNYNIHDITISFYDRGREFIVYQSGEIPVKEWNAKGQDHIMTFSNGKKYREFLISDKKIKISEDAKKLEQINELFNTILNKIQELEIKIADEAEKEDSFKDQKKRRSNLFRRRKPQDDSPPVESAEKT